MLWFNHIYIYRFVSEILFSVLLLYIADAKEENTLQLDRDLSFLVDIPTRLSEETTVDELNAVYRFVTMIVSKLLGVRSIKKWMRNNKGKSVLDMITMSDIAYTLTLIENNREKWNQIYDISRMTPEEQEKWKKAGKLPKEQRAHYVRKEPRFTSKKGNKASYKLPGINDEGKKYYEKQLNAWKALATDKTSWDMLQEGWNEYNAAIGWAEQWIEQGDSGLATVSVDEEEEEVRNVSVGAFALPGEDGYEHDRVEMSSGAVDNENENEDSEEEGERASGRSRRKKGGPMCDDTEDGSSSSSSSEYDSDQDNSYGVARKRRKVAV